MAPEARRGLIVVAIACAMASIFWFVFSSFSSPFIPAPAFVANTTLVWVGLSAAIAVLLALLGIKNRAHVPHGPAKQAFLVTAFSCLVGWLLLRAAIGAGAGVAHLVEGQTTETCFTVIGKSGPWTKLGRRWLELEAIPPAFNYKLTYRSSTLSPPPLLK